jgi:ribosomal protein S25
MDDNAPVSDTSILASSNEPVPAPPEAPVEVQMAPPEQLTAQIPVNEPLAPAPEPLPPSPPISVIAPVINLARDLAAKARAVIQGRKRVKLEKILTEITKKGFVTNDHVEKLLHVSDATATRYLTQLEKEEKIQQVGKTGKSVKYQKL